MARPSKTKKIIICLTCQKSFEVHPSVTRNYCSRYCALRARKKVGATIEKRTCPVCGETFERNKGNKAIRCSRECYASTRRMVKKVYQPKPPKIKTCPICSNTFTSKPRAKKYCDSCGEIVRSKKSKEFWEKNKDNEVLKKYHSQAAQNWQKKHKEQVRAGQLALKFPNALTIIYECPHDLPRKHNHHFDYSKPFDVIKLCHICHAKWHKKLRQQQPIEATA